MSSEKNETADQILQRQRVTLLDLLDRLIDKGVVAKGEVVLTVADVELVYLNLGLLLSSVKTVENAARRGGDGKNAALPGPFSDQGKPPDQLQPEADRTEGVSFPATEETLRTKKGREKEGSQERGTGQTIAGSLPSLASAKPRQVAGSRAKIDQNNVEKGLVKLVLTLVELVRQLMERQAIRRVEEGQLSEREIENVGNAFSILDEKMEELKKTFGLADEDLNLDLGPLGELL